MFCRNFVYVHKNVCHVCQWILINLLQTDCFTVTSVSQSVNQSASCMSDNSQLLGLYYDYLSITKVYIRRHTCEYIRIHINL